MLNDLVYRLRAFLRRGQVESELQAELQYHLERETEKYRQNGASAEEAMRRARMAIEGPEQVLQVCREGRGTKLVDDLVQDLRYGLRTLGRSPGFTVVTVLTLALGVGACTAIFSVVNAVLLRGLPYGQADRLVYLFTPNPHFGVDVPVEAFGPSYADFFDLRRESHSFASMSIFEQASFATSAENTAIRVGGARVDGQFFSTLESFPEMGRTFGPEEDLPGHSNVVVISHGLWQRMFAGDARILTRSLRLNDSDYRIIGVMPPDFQYPHALDFPPGVSGGGKVSDVWVPIALSPQQKAERNESTGNAIARLKPGVTIRQAQGEMSTLMVPLDLLHSAEMRGFGAYVKPFRDSAVGSARRLMWLLAGAVGLVLLVACGNAAGLLLARAAARIHELGVRATLGAAKGRIVRQMLTESLLLGAGGAAAGIVLAYGFLRGLLRLNPGDIPRLNEASIDRRVLGFTLTVAVLTSVLFGLLPALFAARINLVEFLKTGGNRGSVGSGWRVRGVVVMGEISLVVILLAVAGLLLRSYLKVEGVQPGFSSSTIGMNIELGTHYGELEQRLVFFRSLLAKIQSMPGVEAAGVTSALPLSGTESISSFWVDGYANQKDQWVNDRNITPGYFSAMGISVEEGRSFSESDAPGHPMVVMVNQAFAQKYFGSLDPVGLGVRASGPKDPLRIVIGVVGNVRHTNMETPAPAEVYEPLWQTNIGGNAYLVIRSALPSGNIGTTVRGALRTIDPNLAAGEMQTMGELVSQITARRRFQTTLVTAFAALATVLGMVGILGLLAYSVKQRTAEIGLRIALGASRGRVVGMILRQGVLLSGAGLVVGLVGALGLTRVLTSLLFGVSAVDPVTFIVVPILLLFVTVVACLIPARKAAKVDPMCTLRYE